MLVFVFTKQPFYGFESESGGRETRRYSANFLTKLEVHRGGRPVAFKLTTLEFAPFFKKLKILDFFVVMCNSVCTVCRKHLRKEIRKKGVGINIIADLFSLRALWFTKIIFYCVNLLVPSSSNVAFVLRNLLFFCYERQNKFTHIAFFVYFFTH